MTEENKIFISKEEVFSGNISKERISELARMTAKQVYTQGYNEAIEAAALIADEADEIAAQQIRKLKK